MTTLVLTRHSTSKLGASWFVLGVLWCLDRRQIVQSFVVNRLVSLGSRRVGRAGRGSGMKRVMSSLTPGLPVRPMFESACSRQAGRQVRQILYYIGQTRDSGWD